MKLKLVLIAAAILLFLGGARMVHAQGNKNVPSKADKNKTAPEAGCSPLTTAMIEKVLGQHVQSDPSQKVPLMYGGA